MFENVIGGLVSSIVGGLINNPAVPVSRNDPTSVAATEVVVERAVNQELAPVIAHMTNNEPWYQSRVFLGSAGAFIAAGAAAFGRSWDAATVTQYLVTGVSLAGPLLALYGRFAATKPIGA